MRLLRYSKTFALQLAELLEQGIDRFGPRVIAVKRQAVLDTARNYVAAHPNSRQPDHALGLRRYPVSRTPIVLLYDFDDAEVRNHFIVHHSASLDDLDAKSAQW